MSPAATVLTSKLGTRGVGRESLIGRHVCFEHYRISFEFPLNFLSSRLTWPDEASREHFEAILASEGLGLKTYLPTRDSKQHTSLL